ncbi:hypothetical protein FRC12_021067, partial [Ceratobasidium sp. 428]
MCDSGSDSSTEYSYDGLGMVTATYNSPIARAWAPPIEPVSTSGPSAIPLAEEIDPNALFTQNKQIWDKRTVGNWITRPSKPQWAQTQGSGRLIFQAYERTYGSFGPSSDDHTWIIIRSKPLLELLRSEEILKGLDGLDQDPPGLDARHIFLRLTKLKQRVVELEEIAPIENKTAAFPIEPVKLSIPQVPPVPDPVEPRPPFSQRSWLSALTSWVPYFGNSPLLAPIVIENPQPLIRPTLAPLSVPQQLSELLNFIENHYAELREQLNRLEADGHLPYHLLWTICTPDSIIEGRDEATEKPTGVRVETWDYGAKGEVFTLHGTTYCWDSK